nr:hypothetical protein 2 [bacterium]
MKKLIILLVLLMFAIPVYAAPVQLGLTVGGQYQYVETRAEGYIGESFTFIAQESSPGQYDQLDIIANTGLPGLGTSLMTWSTGLSAYTVEGTQYIFVSGIKYWHNAWEVFDSAPPHGSDNYARLYFYDESDLIQGDGYFLLSGVVPELPPGAMQMLVLALGFGAGWVRRSFK